MLSRNVLSRNFSFCYSGMFCLVIFLLPSRNVISGNFFLTSRNVSSGKWNYLRLHFGLWVILFKSSYSLLPISKVLFFLIGWGFLPNILDFRLIVLDFRLIVLDFHQKAPNVIDSVAFLVHYMQQWHGYLFTLRSGV